MPASDQSSRLARRTERHTDNELDDAILGRKCHAITVVLDKDYREEHVAAICYAIGAIKGVQSATPLVTNEVYHVAHARVARDLRRRVLDAFDSITTNDYPMTPAELSRRLHVEDGQIVRATPGIQITRTSPAADASPLRPSRQLLGLKG